ncbi:hypothetical protein C367_06371 [Cryptococcus neoformans Ze90-1]|nr:hypothetical protein C367_06371 [Cryptococcus neoformans var. grubii Ze90-1]
MFITNITLKDVLEAQARRYSDEAYRILRRPPKKRVPFRNTGLWITISKTHNPWFVQMRKQGAGDPTLHFGAPHHPVHWKCRVCERGGGGSTAAVKSSSSSKSYYNYTTTTEPLPEDEQVEEEEQVQIVYPIVPRPLPPRDKKVRPSKTPHVTVAMAVAVGAAGYRRLSERDYFGTRATWLSEKGYCDASGHAVATSARCEARRIYNDSLELEATTPLPADIKPSSSHQLVPRAFSPTNQSSYEIIVLEDHSPFSESTWYSSNMSVSVGSRPRQAGDEDEEDDLYEWNAVNHDAPDDQEWEHFKARMNIQQMDRDVVRRRLGRRGGRDEWVESGYQVGGGGRFGDGYGIGSDSTISEWRRSSSDTSLSPWNRSPSLLHPLMTCSVDDLVHPEDSVSRCGSPTDLYTLDTLDSPYIPLRPAVPRGSPGARQGAEGSLPTVDFHEVMEEVMDSTWASEGVRWVYAVSTERV